MEEQQYWGIVILLVAILIAIVTKGYKIIK